MIRITCFCAVVLAVPVFASAGVIVGNPGDTFEISPDGSNSFLLRADPADDFSADPTLQLTAGETYTFEHSGFMHPFALLDDAAPIDATGSGVDGSEFFRTVTDSSFLGNVLDGGSMVAWPIDSSQGSNTLDWTPEEGTYYYTCGVAGHYNMAGQIIVQAASGSVPEPSTFAISLLGTLLLLVPHRRRR